MGSFRLVVTAAFLIASRLGFADTTPGPKKTDYVKLEAIKLQKVSAVKRTEVKVQAHIQAGFHIQANPASQPNLIPTTIFVEAVPDVDLGVPVFPAGKPYRLKGSDRDILTYEKTVEFVLPLVAKGNAKPGAKHSLIARLRYQPCDDKICYFPQTVPFTIPVEIAK